MVPNSQIVCMTDMATVAADAACTALVDTIGYDYAKIVYLTGISSGISSQDHVSLGESPTSPTAYADCTDVSGCDGTSADFTIVAESTTHSNAYVFNVDLRGRQRYLCLNYESDMTHGGVAIAILSRAENAEEHTDATTAHGVRNIVNAGA